MQNNLLQEDAWDLKKKVLISKLGQIVCSQISKSISKISDLNLQNFCSKANLGKKKKENKSLSFR